MVRIIIVDDHQLMAEGLMLLLRKSTELEVVGVAGDCAAARQLAHDLRPDLILMDVDLPDGSGIELTTRLHGEFPGMKVLVLTAHLEPRVALQAMEAGASGFLTKTNATHELIEAIQAVMTGGVYAGATGRGAQDSSAPTSGNGAPMRLRPVLPSRESQVLARLFRGLRNKEIATELGLSEKTVETYRSRLMKRFGCTSLAELIRQAIREGLAPD